MHLLQNLEELVVPPDALLVAVDVEALYSSIPHQLGILAIGHAISQSHRDNQAFNEFVLLSLEYILTHNVFSFYGTHFLQMQGMAMGTCCGPSYANLYLGEWVQSFLSDDNLTQFTDKILTWYHYIDDILIVWNESINLLNQ